MKKYFIALKINMFIMLVILCIISINAKAQNIILINNAVGFADSTVIISVNIQNEEPYSTFTFEIELPDDFYYDDNSVVINTPNSNIHFNVFYISDNQAIKVTGSSLNNPITDWISYSFALNTPSESCTYPLKLRNVIFSNIENKNIIDDVINGNISIINKDYVGKIQLHNAVGIINSTVDIDIEINIEVSIVSMGYHLLLPQGFNFMQNSTVVDPPFDPAVYNVITEFKPWNSTLIVAIFSLQNQYLPSDFTITHTLNTPSEPGIYFPLFVNNKSVSNGLEVINGIIIINHDGPTLPGDANCDGEINTFDVVTFINLIMGDNPIPFCFINADINQDGNIDITDAVSTVNIIMNRR